MIRFRFSLEKILNLRALEEEQVRRELKEALAVVAEIEEELAWLTRIRNSGEEALFVVLNRTPFDASRVLFMQDGLAGVERERVKTASRLKEAVRVMEEVQDRYKEARKERKVLEKIREKQQERHNAVVKAEEIKRLNEVAVDRFFQRSAR